MRNAISLRVAPRIKAPRVRASSITLYRYCNVLKCLKPMDVSELNWNPSC